MRIKELEFLMRLGMISVDDDNINHVIKVLKQNGFEVI